MRGPDEPLHFEMEVKIADGGWHYFCNYFFCWLNVNRMLIVDPLLHYLGQSLFNRTLLAVDALLLVGNFLQNLQVGVGKHEFSLLRRVWPRNGGKLHEER